MLWVYRDGVKVAEWDGLGESGRVVCLRVMHLSKYIVGQLQNTSSLLIVKHDTYSTRIWSNC